jgi:hypothetical protein
MQLIHDIASKEGGREKLNEAAAKVDITTGAFYQYLNTHGNANQAQNGSGSSAHTHYEAVGIDVTAVPTSHERMSKAPSPAEKAATQALHILDNAEKNGTLVQLANEMAGIKTHVNESQAGSSGFRNIVPDVEIQTPNSMSQRPGDGLKKDAQDEAKKPLNESDASDFIQLRVLENLRTHVANTENAKVVDDSMTV